MLEKTLLKEEIEEEKALRDFIQKFNEEYFLEKDLTEAELEGNAEEVFKIKKELESVTFQRIQLKEKHLRAKVKSAVAIKQDFINFLITKYGKTMSLIELEKFIPTFIDENLREAEDELHEHLEKYNK